jgi:8-oxo-dGTP diphosphatase
MPDRSTSARGKARGLTLTVDVVLLTPRGGQLAVLLTPVGGARRRERWSLPADAPRSDETLHDVAGRVAREVLGTRPSLLDQAAAFGGGRTPADGPQVCIAFVGLVPDAGAARRGAVWSNLSELPALAARQREAIDAALDAARSRIDQQPIAFRLLHDAFTLSELQSVYELLLGRKVHKASFRRSLHASGLVEATDEWRSEGRGRPAQLFRYAPPRRRRQRRGIRFDLLG